MYCIGNVYEIILKVLYEENIETQIVKIFASDVKKIGTSIVSKDIEYINDNTFS